MQQNSVVYHKSRWLDFSNIPGLDVFETVYYELTKPTETTFTGDYVALEKSLGLFTTVLLQDSK